MVGHAPYTGRRPGLGGASYGQVPFLSNIPQTLCLADPYNMGGITCRQYYPNSQSAFGQPLILPYYIGYAPTDYQSVVEEPPPPQPVPNDLLANQIERLADEVQLLREERASREGTAPHAAGPQPPAESESVPAALVYRDGHRSEVRNYAILGETLWVFAGQTTKRIALADLDLRATEKLNAERGVDFLPADSSYRN